MPMSFMSSKSSLKRWKWSQATSPLASPLMFPAVGWRLKVRLGRDMDKQQQRAHPAAHATPQVRNAAIGATTAHCKWYPAALHCAVRQCACALRRCAACSQSGLTRHVGKDVPHRRRAADVPGALDLKVRIIIHVCDVAGVCGGVPLAPQRAAAARRAHACAPLRQGAQL